MVLAVLIIVVLLGMVAFTADIGYLTMTKANAYSAVDAGSLAAAAQLYNGRAEAKSAMLNYVTLNGIDAQQIGKSKRGSVEIEYGTWDTKASEFTTTDDQSKTNAVRVTAELTQVDSFFGRVLGKNSYTVKASSIAVKSAPLDIMLVLDLSGSMSENGRIKALQQASPKFVSAIETLGNGNQIGVMGFSADPKKYNPVAEGHTGRLYTPAGLVQPGGTEVAVLEADLTSDFDGLRNSVLTAANLAADKYDGATGTGAAIRDATHYLKNSSFARSNTTKFIVLMSDGLANRPSGSADDYAMQHAEAAKGQKVIIHTISLGSDADTNLLRSIAKATGGKFFNAPGDNVDSLKKTLQDAFEAAAAAASRPVLVH